MTYIFDSYAWIEYFLGTSKGLKVRNILDGDNKILTLECNISELYGWASRECRDFDFILRFIESRSELIPINIMDWINAAKIKIEMRKLRKNFGLIDSLLITKQKEFNCKVVTGDNHFLNLNDVVMI